MLLTFGLILIFEELRSILVGDDVHSVAIPAAARGLAAADRDAVVSGVPAVHFGRLPGARGADVRDDPEDALRHDDPRRARRIPKWRHSLGLDIRWIHALVFAAGVALAAFAGMIAAPVSSVFPGMGNQVLIVCFVVVVIGGIGSLKGALVAALLIGFADTFGKVLFPDFASIAVYLLMAVVLLFRPLGLFGRA